MNAIPFVLLSVAWLFALLTAWNYRTAAQQWKTAATQWESAAHSWERATKRAVALLERNAS